MEIQIEHLKKYYGRRERLKGIDLTLSQGMHGLLGKNGAGKTTLLQILATRIKKNEGTILINKIPIENYKKIREIIGYLPQSFDIYPGMKVLEAMEYFDLLCEMPRRSRKERIASLLSALHLKEQEQMRVKTLSGGMKRRLGLAIALLNDPEILLIDEPTAGVDPQERAALRNVLCELAESKIVLFSTHLIEDIEAACEYISVIDDGRLIFSGKVSEYRRWQEQ